MNAAALHDDLRKVLDSCIGAGGVQIRHVVQTWLQTQTTQGVVSDWAITVGDDGTLTVNCNQREIPLLQISFVIQTGPRADPWNLGPFDE